MRAGRTTIWCDPIGIIYLRLGRTPEAREGGRYGNLFQSSIHEEELRIIRDATVVC